MKNFKNTLLIALTAVIIFGFSLIFLLSKSNDYSYSERRALAKAPKPTSEAIMSGSFMSDFEDYTLDQFPFRDSFRAIKANALKYGFLQKDNHKIYLKDGYLSKLEYPENNDKTEISLNKLNEVYQKQLQNTDCKLYLSIIPDKNYFLAPLGGYPTIDYNAYTSNIKSRLDFAEYIDIFDCLGIESYYCTDQHWRQEKIVNVAQRLTSSMGSEISTEFNSNKLENPFYGAYYGQAALKVKPDELYYLTNKATEACTVTSYNTGKAVSASVYDLEKANGRDPYEMFLCGSDALVTIENPQAKSDKELVIFRDSFTSSLAPLMISGYKKITLIDLRYLRSDMISYFVKFDNQDVLFLYSTLVFNNNISM